MFAGLLLIAFVVVGVALVLILTDLVTVPPTMRANASKIATVLFLGFITWVFVVMAMSQ